FLCPSPNWKNSSVTKKKASSTSPQHRNVFTRTEPSWYVESKENIIDISDNEDLEVVGVWQDTNTQRKCPVYRSGLSRKETLPVQSSNDDDDEIEVVKVVESLSKQIERSNNKSKYCYISIFCFSY
ncbi:hypothetical protein L9F63_026063, partial [Diploptera punctata]